MRARAHLLRKALGGADPDEARAAAARFARHPRFRDRPATPGGVRLKHALDVVAREAGHASWAALKQHADTHRESDRFYPAPTGALNHWFRTWEEARAHLDRAGGYLLPYRHQFFVCGPLHIVSLGLFTDDPDWERIGFDAARPADPEAWERLRAQLPDRPLA